ncbi:hypothetical protein L6164_036282 [Bauhinia variegata]|uniref:Uncharacterized protein n=1 Tax=Bauhinia variegata TaxID=167791 RepID=A0ACB9KGP0_BAUVA|nr:hypothetical protein L6164_036282 [Bauhinia variegata]
MPSKLRKALGAVKDQTSISLAKVGGSTSLADLDVAIVKATRHDEHPSEEKYIREILSLTCYSKSFIGACVNTLTRRLNKTKSWTVAMKTLILIQRLIAEGDPAYEEEIFFSTRRGTRLLNMSDFLDTRSNSWDFSAFVRTYALYLDERLEYRMQKRRGRRSRFGIDEEEEEAYVGEKEKEKEITVRSTPASDMKTEQLFSQMQHLQQLLERFLACRPTGEAKSHRICIVALYPIVKESFQIYKEIIEVMNILVDRFTDMEVTECVKVYEIFCRVGKHFDELDLFYSWSKNIGIARSSEYPEIEKITPKKLEVMDEFIRDKSSKRDEAEEDTQEEEVLKEPEPEPEEDRNEIKALPAPEESADEVQEVKEEAKEEEPKKEKVVQTEGDLLNLGEDAVTSEEHGNTLALALFDGAAGATAAATQALPWHAFDETEDWETALVQSDSNLNNQKPELGGGFDTLLLDGMYKHAETNAAMQGPGYGVSGSASSVALGSAGRPAMLALPAPPTSGSGASSGCSDPFAASLAVAPPTFVQMAEMEKKQKLLVEEQMMWHQFEKDGRQGIIASKGLQPQPYAGGYQQNYGNYYR